MTDDQLLVVTLKNILQNLIEERTDVENHYDLNDDFNSELLDEYNDYIQILDGLIPEIKSIDDLFEKLDDDEFAFVVEQLENYAETFILDGRDEQLLEQQEKEYSQLCDILFDFYDDESDDESED